MEWNFDNVKYNGKDLDRVQVDGVTVWEKALPYDAEIEYLECTRQQWINTGISLYNVPSFSFEIDFEPTANYDFNAIFCIDTGTTYEGWIYSSGLSQFRMCGRPKAIQSSLTRQKWVLDWSVNGFTFKIDDKSATEKYSSAMSIDTESPLWLLHRVDYATGKLYGFKLWKENVLVMDLIPVRVGQVGYMYDKVSRQLFGNAGTGDFILGNDIEYYDYLQNDGVAHIDTGVVGDSDISIEFKFINLGTRNKFICGANGYCPLIMQSNGYFNTRYYKQNEGVLTVVLPLADSEEHIMRYNFDNSIYFDGVAYVTNANIVKDTDNTILLYGSQTGTAYNTTMKLFYCKIYDNGVLIRDFVPCKYAGQYGLWDKVNNKFYGNANSEGSFSVDKMYYDYLQGDSTAYIDTDYIANSNSELRFKYNNQLTTSISCLFSSRQKYATRDISYFPTANGATKPQIVFGSFGLASSSSIVPSETAEVTMRKGLIKYNNLQFTFSGTTFTCPDNLLLFKNSPSSTYSGTFNGKLYYLQIYDNGTLIRDYKPCLYNGEAGLWDSVENKFYGNANNTGLLTVGNE